MTREWNIAAIREILRDCGEENEFCNRTCVVEYAGEETEITLQADKRVTVTDAETGLVDYIETYAPFEVQGFYEALMEKYRK